jgi:hypothetical protein
MRIRTAVGGVLVAAMLTGCAQAQNRDLARYYDPQGLFSADLPAANRVSVTAPQQGQGSASVLSGVVAAPPQPSASPASQLPGGLTGVAQQAPPSDQTLYQVLVVTTDGFASLESMALYFLTGDPSIDVREDRPIPVGRTEGRLVVADVMQSGSARASIAAAFTLGTDGVGYIVAAVFPSGDWGREEPDFARIVGSLSPTVPTGLRTFPLSSG